MSFLLQRLKQPLRKGTGSFHGLGGRTETEVEVESGQIPAPDSNSLTMGAVQGGAWEQVAII